MIPPPTDPPHPAGTILDFDTRGGRLEVTLGARRVDAGPVDPALETTLISGLEAVLGSRAVVGGQHRLALDEAGTRRLGVRHRAEGLELSLLDVHDRPVVPPQPLALAGFARAVQAFVGRSAPNHDRGADLRALVGWAEALDGDEEPPPAAPPPARLDAARPARIIPAARLPVGTLYHLAYRRAWRHEAPGLVEMAADPERVAVFDARGLQILDRVNGAVRFDHPGLRWLDGPTPMRGAVDAQERPIRLDARGAIRWRGAPPEGEAPLQALHPGEPAILAVTAGREVYGLDPADGRARWRYTTHYGEVLGATVRGGLAWLTAEDGFVHGLDLEDGQRRFAVNPAGGLDGRPRLTPGGLLVGLDAPDGSGSRLACLDPLTGRTRWSTALPGHLSRPPVAADDAVLTVLEHGPGPMLAVLDGAQGTIRWHRRLDGPDVPVVRPLGELLVVKHVDGSAAALDRSDGALRWWLASDDPELTLRVNPPPVPCRGLLLVPGTTIRAVDPADGRVVHRVDCDELVPERLHVWPDGDLAIAEHDAVARYLLGGHLALVG